MKKGAYFKGTSVFSQTIRRIRQCICDFFPGVEAGQIAGKMISKDISLLIMFSRLTKYL